MTVMNVAVSGKSGTGHITTGDAIDSSFLNTQGHEVPVVTLESIMGLVPKGAKVMVKMDQGCPGSHIDAVRRVS
jgi:hypothetical protein